MLNLDNKKTYQDILDNLNKKIRMFSLVRGILFIGFIIFLITFFTTNYNFIHLYVSIALLLAFIIFIVVTKKYYVDRKYYENIIFEFNRHEFRRDSKFNNAKYFFDKGNDFKRKYQRNSLRDKYLIEDIDIFGNNSLYQNMSSAHSVLGRNLVADSIIHGEKYFDERNQNKFSEKVNKLGNDERLILVNSALAFNRVEDSIDYDTYLDNLSMKFSIDKKRKLGLLLVLLIDIIVLVLSLTVFSPFLLMLIPIINIFYSFQLRDEIDLINSTNMYFSIENNLKVIKYLSKIDLKDLNIDIDFSHDLKMLKRLIYLWQFLSYKNNFVFKLIFNCVYCFDGLFQMLYNKLIPSKDSIRSCLNKIADLEVISSYANLVSDYETCMPTVSEKLEFTDLVNPLVKNCVSNSFTYNRGVVLTGSNMSGKTTFMRTIAINLLIFSGGGLPLASSFSSKVYKLYTSLRIKDEMSEGVSTFYAEIEKIREMLAKEENNKLCLIDEIFKGTNTLDRVYGATKLIEKLQKENYDFFISTHDFELCNIETIDNYHFNEHFNEDYTQIYFDYKIENGKSRSTNAIFLLKSSGIID